MKQNLIRLSQQYETALRTHLKPGARASSAGGTALALGRQAVACGLETLGLAKIHEQALATIQSSNAKKGWRPRAQFFFTAANAPIEATHRAARQGKVHLNRMQETLGQRTAELATSKRQLQRGVVRRQVMAEAAAKSGQHRDQCLEESLQLQKRLRELTHRVLAAQEDERHKISHELQDEIAQTLLGINARLLALKQKTRSHTKGLKQEITSTQQLVLKSAKSVRRFARELGTRPPARGRKLSVDELRVERPHTQLSTHPSSVAALRRVDKTLNSLAAPAGFPVIAMAASVGGLHALSVILGDLPANFPAAIAIVMHLAPDHKSILAEILKSRTHLAVKQAHTGDILCQSNVFIAPPNHHLFVAGRGRLKLSSSHAEKVHYARPSAEPLFASVAQVYGKNAIAVVLTGGDGDGSFGVQIIKEKGGTVIAQDRSTSENFSMPETSIQTGDVDFILPLKEIAPMLIALVWAGKPSGAGQPNLKPRVPTPALAELVTPHYAAGTKAAMLKRRDNRA